MHDGVSLRVDESSPEEPRHECDNPDIAADAADFFGVDSDAQEVEPANDQQAHESEAEITRKDNYRI